jgi:hypothetical protein
MLVISPRELVLDEEMMDAGVGKPKRAKAKAKGKSSNRLRKRGDAAKSSVLDENVISGSGSEPGSDSEADAEPGGDVVGRAYKTAKEDRFTEEQIETEMEFARELEFENRGRRKKVEDLEIDLAQQYERSVRVRTCGGGEKEIVYYDENTNLWIQQLFVISAFLSL